MYSKNIVINMETTTIGTVDAPKRNQRCFEIMAFFAAVLTQYVVTHYKEFERLTKYDEAVKAERIYGDNIRVCRIRLFREKYSLINLRIYRTKVF